MAFASWPGGVPTGAIQGSLTEQVERNISSFEVDLGPPLESRQSSIATSFLSFEALMLRTQYVLLIAWYRDTLKDGVLSFNRKHPFYCAGGNLVMRFTAVPSYTAITGGRGRVRMSFRILPA